MQNKTTEIIADSLHKTSIPYCNGITWVKYSHWGFYWGALDENQEVVIPFIYNRVKKVTDSIYIVQSMHRDYGVIDNTGYVIIPLEYDDICVITNGVFILYKFDNISFKSFEGTPLFEDCDFSDVQKVITCHGGFFIQIITDKNAFYLHYSGNHFCVNKKYCYIDSNEKYLVLSDHEATEQIVYSNKGTLVYKGMFTFCSSYLRNDTLYLEDEVSESHIKAYVINLLDKKQLKIDNIEEINPINGEYFAVTCKNRSHPVVMSVGGDVVIPEIYDDLRSIYRKKITIDDEDSILCPNDIFIFAKKNSKWGVINLPQKEIIDFKYDWITEGDFNQFIAERDRKSGVVDINDKVIIPFEYDRITNRKEGYYIAYKKKKSFYYDSLGNQILSGTFKFSGDEFVLENNEYDNSCEIKDIYGNHIESFYYEKDDYDRDIFDIYWDQENLIPCKIVFYLPFYYKGYKVSVESMKKMYSYCELKDLLFEDSLHKQNNTIRDKEYSPTFKRELCVLLGYNGYYIFNNYKIGATSYIINPECHIIYKSIGNTFSFVCDTNDCIEISTSEGGNIIINKQKHRLQLEADEVDAEIIPTDSINYSVLREGTSFGVVDKKSNLLFPAIHDNVTIFGDVIFVEENGGEGILFYKGIKIIYIVKYYERWEKFHCISSELNRFCSEYLILRQKLKNYPDNIIVLDQKGNILLTDIGEIKTYDKIHVIYPYSTYNEDDDKFEKCAIFDKDFQPLYPDEYITNLRKREDGSFIGIKENTIIIYDEHGKKVFSSDKYTEIREFHEGLAVVYCNGYGVIDIFGNEIVPCIHSYISDFSDGKAQIRKYGYLITLYNDGTTDKILWGKFNASLEKELFCHIVDGKLSFVDRELNAIKDNPLSDLDELSILLYNNEGYHVYNEDIYNAGNALNLAGNKMLFVGKDGIILECEEPESFIRLSSSCILLNTTILKFIQLSDGQLHPIKIMENENNGMLITSTGRRYTYIYSFNKDVHFVLSNDSICVIDSSGDILWKAHNGEDSFSFVGIKSKSINSIVR